MAVVVAELLFLLFLLAAMWATYWCVAVAVAWLIAVLREGAGGVMSRHRRKPSLLSRVRRLLGIAEREPIRTRARGLQATDRTRVLYTRKRGFEVAAWPKGGKE